MSRRNCTRHDCNCGCSNCHNSQIARDSSYCCGEHRFDCHTFCQR